MTPERIYEFVGHTVDLGRGRLQRGREDIAIRPKSLTLLIYLLENAGRVIDKEELISAVWQTSFVGDGSLSQCLNDIRAALGSTAEGFIRTIPRRGYMVDAHQAHRRSRLPMEGYEKPSIAILPFRPLGNDREHNWFAEGLTDDIAMSLTRSRQLTIISRLAIPTMQAAIFRVRSTGLAARVPRRGTARSLPRSSAPNLTAWIRPMSIPVCPALPGASARPAHDLPGRAAFDRRQLQWQALSHRQDEVQAKADIGCTVRNPMLVRARQESLRCNKATA